MSKPMREISNPTSVAWLPLDTESVLIWNRYTGKFSFALSNTPGTVPMSVLSAPWCDGTESLKEARKLAQAFFAPTEESASLSATP